MSQFSVKATFDGADLVKGFKDVKKEVEGLESVGENAKKSLDQMLQQKNSTSNYRRQLAMITKELTDLTVNYRALSDAEKQSEFGQALSQRIDELSAKAAEFKDAMLDVQQSINKSASDTANWDAFSSVIDITTSSLQTFAGVTGMSKKSTEALTRTIVTLQTVGAASNTIIKVGNALQKQSALMLGVARAQNAAAAVAIKLKTAAENKGVIATKAATVAQKIFNAVANANPYVLLATAVLAVGTALFAYARNASSSAAAQEELNEKQEEARDLNAKLAHSIGSVVADYNLLKREYIGISSLSEKQKWIEENASAFERLGLQINGVNDADKVFVEYSDEVIAALKARAKAEALIEKYKEAVVKGEEKKKNFEDSQFIPKAEKFAGGASGLPDNYKPYSDLFQGIDGYYTGGQIQYGPKKGVTQETINERAQQLREKYNAQVDTEVEYWEGLIDAAEKDAQAAAAKVPNLVTSGGKGTGGTGSTGGGAVEETPDKNSLRAAELEVQKLQDKLNKMSITSPDFEPTKKALAEAQAKVAKIKKLMEDPDYGAESLRAAELEVQKLQDKLNKMDTTSPDFDTTKQALAEAQAKVAEIKKLMEKPVELTLVEQYDAAKKKINEIVKEFEIGIIDEEKAKEQIDSINKELQKLGLKPIEIKLKPDAAPAEQKGKWDGYFDKDNDTNTAVDTVIKAYNLKLVDKDYAKEAIDAINVDRINAGLQPIHINLDVENIKSQIDQATQWFNAFSSIGNVVSNVNGIYESFMNLGDAMDEAKNGWEEFMVGFELGMQIMNAVVGIMGTINTIMETFTMIQEMVTAAKLKDTAASTAKAGADTASATAATAVATADAAAAAATTTKATTDAAATAAAGTKAGADTAAAVASTAVATADTAAAAASGAKATTDVAGAAAAGTKAAADVAGAAASSTAAAANTAAAVSGAAQSVSWMPIVGPILAVAAIAAVIGGIMAAMNKGKFASGGIVPGPSKIGDFNIARVNGGEMILNTRQQANLFNMLDHNRVNDTSSAPQNVSFRIQGDTLVGVIDNYNKKRGRI